jgi:small subunit ribosomal protein S17
MAIEVRGNRKVRVGRVVSDKMEKSITVAVVRKVKHPIYKKYFQSTKKYMAHDETNDAQVGDLVSIMECRPLSRHKRWRLTEVIERRK